MKKKNKDKLPNEYFRDIPIEFKQINQEDFDSNLYNVPLKKIIKTNDDGYISDTLLPVLENDFNNINTTVINAGVGQGKTTAILKMVDKFIKEDYVVIIAVPFKSLIEQYKKDCEKVVEKKEIFDIQVYDNKNNLPYNNTIEKEHKIHLVTVNALLANSGDSVIQSSKKLSHFDRLISKCEQENRKCIIIFDEIHEAIHNFKEYNIHRLWCYQGIIHKIYTISATYNEASKELIKYLSELTNRNIFIIETERTIIPKKQSNLYINLFTDTNIERDENLIELLKKIKTEKKPFDILVYSKNLSKELANHLLSNNKDKLDINRCYAGASKDKNRYNPNQINIGTNFSTGVNIEKENHSYIIIFPKDVYIPFVNNNGVFSSGIISVIQGLARQRKPGDIHIFMPPPQKIDIESLPNHYTYEQKTTITNLFDTAGNDILKSIKYSDINKQNKEIDTIYLKFKKQFSKGIIKLKERDENEKLNRLLFPPREIFLLDRGEQVLTESFFGGSLSSYILWSAVCNQFINCDLKGINYPPKIKIKSETFFEDLSKLYKEEVDILIEHNKREKGVSTQPFEIMSIFNKIIDTSKISLDGKKATNADIARMKTYILSLIMGIDIKEINTNTKKQVYHRYLKSCIYYSFMHHKVSKNSENNIFEYQQLFNLVDCIYQSKQKNQKGDFIVDMKYNDEFKTMFDDKNIEDTLDNLARNDVMLNKVFGFKETFLKTKEEKEKKCQSLYKLLILSCLDGKSYRTSKKTLKENETSKYLINYLYDTDEPEGIETLTFKGIINLLYKVDVVPLADIF